MYISTYLRATLCNSSIVAFKLASRYPDKKSSCLVAWKIICAKNVRIESKLFHLPTLKDEPKQKKAYMKKYKYDLLSERIYIISRISLLHRNMKRDDLVCLVRSPSSAFYQCTADMQPLSHPHTEHDNHLKVKETIVPKAIFPDTGNSRRSLHLTKLPYEQIGLCYRDYSRLLHLTKLPYKKKGLRYREVKKAIVHEAIFADTGNSSRLLHLTKLRYEKKGLRYRDYSNLLHLTKLRYEKKGLRYGDEKKAIVPKAILTDARNSSTSLPLKKVRFEQNGLHYRE